MALYTAEEGLPAAKFLLGVVVEAVIERLLAPLAPRPRGSAGAPKLVLPANSYNVYYTENIFFNLQSSCLMRTKSAYCPRSSLSLLLSFSCLWFSSC